MAEALARPLGASPLIASSVATALLYPLLWSAGLPDAALVALKGAAVGSLATLAAMRARTVDGRLLAAVLAFGALGDVLLEVRFEAGVAAFAVGHAVAIALYLRNRRPVTTATQRAAALSLVLLGGAAPFVLLGDHPGLAALAVYSLLLTTMAAAAWVSRFPRYRTGLGAVLFVVSDALIAARMGPLAGRESVGYAIWLLYYVGQLMIFVGVGRTLGGDRR